MRQDEVNRLREQSRKDEVSRFLTVCSGWLALPLFMLFWLVDIVYAPAYRWEFLLVRALIIPVCLITGQAIRRVQTAHAAQIVGLVFVACNSLDITWMIYRTGEGWNSPYYAGLNLVGFGVLTFVPWNRRFLAAAAAATYVPFVVVGFLPPHEPVSETAFVSTFMVVGTAIISLVVRYFTEHLRRAEMEHRVALERTIRDREETIRLRTQEAVRLRGLARQFSPQIVEGINSGRISLVASTHNTEICAIFIDIVESTSHLRNMDIEHVNRVITMFMEDTMKVLLKYDITIDKFLGDGILAFSNDPVKRPDYVERVIDASLDVLGRIRSRAEEYRHFWKDDLKVRIGIATGTASVGFFGSDESLKAYTALGEVMNLANRLCSAANPNQIVVSEVIAEKVFALYPVRAVGPRALKGFGKPVVVFEVVSDPAEEPTSDVDVCPVGHGVLHLDVDDKGIHVFRCRACDYVLGGTPSAAGGETDSNRQLAIRRRTTIPPVGPPPEEKKDKKDKPAPDGGGSQVLKFRPPGRS